MHFVMSKKNNNIQIKNKEKKESKKFNIKRKIINPEQKYVQRKNTQQNKEKKKIKLYKLCEDYA